MQIYFSGRIIIHVPEPVHNLVQRYPGFRQEGCMRMPEYMWRDVHRYLCNLLQTIDAKLETLLLFRIAECLDGGDNKVIGIVPFPLMLYLS